MNEGLNVKRFDLLNEDDFVIIKDKQMLLHNIKNVELKEKDKEIERLTKQNKALNETYELTKKEYIRLNNIINELEKYIDEKNKIKLETDGYIWQLKRPSITCKDLKNKLQELKGSE